MTRFPRFAETPAPERPAAPGGWTAFALALIIVGVVGVLVALAH